jgi:type VI secretion system secreted protein Hcp
MAFDAFLYVFGAPGESTATLPDKSATYTPIELLSYDLGVTMTAAPSRSGFSGATTGRAKFNEFNCEKNIDMSTAVLCYYCSSGKHIPEIYIDIYRSAGDTKVKFATLIYKDAVITECSAKCSGSEDLPKETLKFNYGSVEFKYVQTDHKTGAATSNKTRFLWSQITNKGEKS